MNRDLCREVLAGHPYFGALPREARELLAHRSAVRTYDQGALVFTQGEQARGLFLVVTGAVRLYQSSEEGKEQVLHYARPGESFNDVAAFDGGPCPASALAVERTTLLFVPREVLLEVLQRYPQAALSALETLAGRLREVARLVEALSLKNVTARVAAVLLRLSDVGDPIPLPTRQELAAMAGTVREVATRALTTLEGKGLIRIGPGRLVTILNRQGLERVSEGLSQQKTRPPGSGTPRGSRESRP